MFQAQRQRDSNNIIIDLNMPKEVEQFMYKSQDDVQKKQKKLLHQSSYPIILVNVHSTLGKIVPATSLNALQADRVEDKIASKSRSLDDTHAISYDDRY